MEEESRIKREILSEFRWDVQLKADELYETNKNVKWFRENLKKKG